MKGEQILFLQGSHLCILSKLCSIVDALTRIPVNISVIFASHAMRKILQNLLYKVQATFLSGNQQTLCFFVLVYKDKLFLIKIDSEVKQRIVPEPVGLPSKQGFGAVVTCHDSGSDPPSHGSLRLQLRNPGFNVCHQSGLCVYRFIIGL